MARIKSCRVVFITLALVSLWSLDAVGADLYPDTPVGRQLRWVVDMFNRDTKDKISAHVAPSFLKSVSPFQLKVVIKQTRASSFNRSHVFLERVKDGATDRRLRAVLASTEGKETLLCTIGVEKDSGLISSLFLKPIPPELTWAELDERLEALPGIVSFAAGELLPEKSGGYQVVSVHTYHQDRVLALGSAFKLYVLGALAEQVQDGVLSFSDTLLVDENLKSLPSGEMQNEAAGSRFPISHFCNKMISISDNTATDHLISKVGRKEIEAYVSGLQDDPAKSFPFLGTQEMFKLKLAVEPAVREQYIASSVEERRKMLLPAGEIGQVEVTLMNAAMWLKPIVIDQVEWFASAQEMLVVMADLHRLEQQEGCAPVGFALRINPGISLDRKNWQSVGFKGGSEPGVINLTFLLERQDGRWFALSLGWNNTENPVIEAQAVTLAAAAVKILGKRISE